jgi:hypothetical protein
MFQVNLFATALFYVAALVEPWPFAVESMVVIAALLSTGGAILAVREASGSSAPAR